MEHRSTPPHSGTIAAIAKVDCLQSKQEQVTQSEIGTPKRTFGPFNILAAAFNICQAWAAIGATFALGVGHGGSMTIIYGLVLILLVYTAIALSAAELVARYPTAGGQYHWTSLIAPAHVRREL
ncbi:hypothetical protein MMC12_007847, partial [Toensbergia leucococca]|nr:hypothetical protein [Toensbergia leucococca]